MERIPSPAHGRPVTLEIDAVPVTLRLPRGAAIFAVRGETWLTQERRPDDVILAHGARYDLADSAPIVVSATRGRATLQVVRPLGACHRMARDAYDLARCRAQALRREELSRVGAAIAGTVRSVVLRLRSAFPTRARLTTQ